MTPQHLKPRFRPLPSAALLLLGVLGSTSAALAQLTDVAQVPLSTASPTVVKPNVMFILDDSGSMARDHMPDDANNFTASKYGRFASQCNGLAYNPVTAYALPVTSTGANYPAGAFTFPSPNALSNVRTISSAAPTVGTGSVTVTISGTSGSYSNGSIVTLFSNADTSVLMVGTVTAWNGTTRALTVNVSSAQGSGTLTTPRIGDGDNRPFYYTYSGSQPRLGFTYNSSGVIDTTTFYTECFSNVGSTPGSSVFARVVMTPSSTDIQNYRNWNTYYRTRMLTMQSAASLAFRPIGDRFRVGFSTISKTTVSGSMFLDVADFNASHKALFYTELFGSPPSGYTPLRGALSKAGKYFAKRATRSDGGAQTYDPMQYSCQRNVAILTTDGYWNIGDGNSTYDPGEEIPGSGSNSYGPDRLDNTDVGQQDGGATPRPMRDSGSTTVSARTSDLQQRTITLQAQTSTSTLQSRTGPLQTRTSIDSGSTWSAWTNVTSPSTCTWDTSGSSRRDCRYNWSAWSNAASCTRNMSTGTSGGTVWSVNIATDCQYTAWTAYANSASCTAVAQSPGPNYTVGTATQCNTVTTNGLWSNTATCTASATTGCQYTAWTAYSLVSACVAAPQSIGPNYTVSTARECQTTTIAGPSDTLADVAMYYYQTDLRTAALGNCASTLDGTPTGIPSNVCSNNVRPSGNDDAPNQHMTTYTLGMGVGGLLPYRSDYLSATSGAYYNILQGTAEWPVPGPTRAAENIDDLWHAAVNGRGRYFSAGDPTTLAQSLAATLQAIDAETGSGSGAAASTLQPVAGDNTLFIAKYKTVHWVGDLVARSIDPITGAISAPVWSAAQQLQARVTAGTPRDIRYFQRGSGNTGALRSFTYANLLADGLNGHFDSACSKSPALTQCGVLNTVDTAVANLGANMVDYLRGGSNPVYRTRFTGDADIGGGILGDVIGGAPVFVRRPSFSYTENDYAGFVASVNATNAGAGRTGVAYVASNDGMLHAFDGTTGAEKWAYVPTMVMNRMYRLADRDYANRHEFFVNGAPVIGDIFVPGSPGRWKTILIGGLGAGGRGYYALDITDPENPIALWEFSNDSLGGGDNLGLTFGNPVITKRADGTWVVVFSSGYNNVSPGDGNGHLYVVNANTGQRNLTVPTYTSGTTPAGTTTMPSGLGKINAWIDSEIDNRATRFYGGDVLGNLWRFDIDNLVAPNQAALRLGFFENGGVRQSITTQPALAEVNYNGSRFPVVYVGTGKYIGATDLTHTATQSVYALKDPLTNAPLGDVRANSTVVAQTFSEAGLNLPRTVTNLAVNWVSGNGWRVDLLSPGERVNVDMQLLYNTLTFASNIPSNDVCTIGGSSYLYQLDIGTGSIPSTATSTVAGRWLGGSMVVGISWVTLEGPGGVRGGGRTVTITVDNRGIPRTDPVPPPPPPTGTGRRTSWRELVQ